MSGTPYSGSPVTVDSIVVAEVVLVVVVVSLVVVPLALALPSVVAPSVVVPSVVDVADSVADSLALSVAGTPYSGWGSTTGHALSVSPISTAVAVLAAVPSAAIAAPQCGQRPSPRLTWSEQDEQATRAGGDMRAASRGRGGAVNRLPRSGDWIASAPPGRRVVAPQARG